MSGMSGDRWATFDCYGTLVDWHGGVRDGVVEAVGAEKDADAMVARYHEVERRIQATEPGLAYREVMARALETVAAENGVTLSPGRRNLLGESLPGWRVFPDVPGGLEEARSRGWRLVILSNTDRDFIEASMASIGVPFEWAVVASEIGSYKPAHGHWQAFAERSDADPARHVHVAQSIFHDVVPGTALGLPTIWINRLGLTTETPPTRELPDLTRLADTLDELVPA